MFECCLVLPGSSFALLFISLLPVLHSIILSLVAFLVAAGLAIYSIFKGGEIPLTVIAALPVAAALLILYAIATFGAIAFAGE